MIETIPVCNLHCIRLFTPNSPWTHCNTGIVRHVGLQLSLQFEPRRSCDSGRLSALDQHWDGTQVANLCQVASMCFNRSRVVVVFYMMSRPAVTLHSHWPLLHWSSDYIMILWSLLFCVPRMPHVSPWACIFEHIWNPLNRLSIQFWMLFVVKLQCIFCILPCSTDGILNFCCTEITFWARFILCQVRYIKLLASRRCFTFSISRASRTFTSRVTKRIYQFSDKLLA